MATASALLPVALRLHVPVLTEAPERVASRTTVQAHAALAANGQWDDLLGALAGADHSRAAAPGGQRLAFLISQGARADLAGAIASGDLAQAELELDRLAAMQAVHFGDPGAAQILAQGHLDLGWARRQALAEHQGRLMWQGFLSHTAEAERILEPFDPIAEDSPLLAATRYQLVRGLEEGETLFRDWYEDWSDLDPTSPDPHAAHAVHLLPHWHGTLEGFDDEARAASKRTRDVSGAAAYAVFYLSAAEALGDMPPGMDIAHFLAGLLDYHHATDCQYRANIVGAALTELAHGLTMEHPGSARLRMVMEVLEDHMIGEIREFHLSAWDHVATGIHWALGEIFAEPLARGEHIHLGLDGLETRPA